MEKLHIFTLRTRALTPAERELLEKRLPESAQERLAPYRARRREQSLLAYSLLDWGLRRVLGESALPEIAAAPGGKPYFPQRPSCYFSLSHTDGLCLAGVYQRPLGVDAERLRAVPPHLRARRPAETTEEAFWQDWVCREALSKLRGSGLQGVLPQPVLMPGEFFLPLQLGKDYAACLCSSGDRPEISSTDCLLQQLLFGT